MRFAGKADSAKRLRKHDLARGTYENRKNVNRQVGISMGMKKIFMLNAEITKLNEVLELKSISIQIKMQNGLTKGHLTTIMNPSTDAEPS